jgi:microcin C transport system substrate-binding protein
MHAIRRSAAALALLALGAPVQAQAPADNPVTVAHAFAMHGDVKYPAGFKNFEYVNPNAPKGGDVKFSAIGSFDSFNAFVLRGVPSALGRAAVETLMTSGGDEPFTEYCLLCETIEVPADRSWVAFNINPKARFHDGTPVTAEDVAWTFDTLKTSGHPSYRQYYASVLKAEVTAPLRVRFTFDGQENRELPLIVGQLAVMSKKWWSTREFDKSSLEPIMGSGPYKVDSFDAGKSVTLRRVPDYWGNYLPVQVGRNNFDTMRYDYYRDGTVALEAFKAGEYDIRVENQALAWATRYESPAMTQGLYKKEEIPERLVASMQGLVMNQRKPLFKDPKVRQAMAYMFDFEWSNKNLFNGAYTRTRSYFDNSELSARGLPDAEELKLLTPLKDQLPPEVFTTEYNPPKTDGTGNIRDNQREALRLFREAGWQVSNQRLVNAAGEQFKFELLLADPQFERIVLPYAENLKRLGMDVNVRTVDTSQYQKRMEKFDYDMTIDTFGQSESPGNEQRDYWSTEAADIEGSNNTPGLKNAAVDRLIEAVIRAPSRADLVTATRALDRVLQWQHLVVPNWHITVVRVASWDRFSRPAITPRAGYDSSTWWVDPQKDAAVKAKRGR